MVSKESTVHSHRSKFRENPDTWYHLNMTGIHIHQFPTHSSQKNTLVKEEKIKRAADSKVKARFSETVDMGTCFEMLNII